MTPFSFQYKEIPTGDSFDSSLIEYDEKLNLNLDKVTGLPAVNELDMATETYTRQNEDADTDERGIGILMATQTCTKSGEGIDDDQY